jgi:hypothetical protein
MARRAARNPELGADPGVEPHAPADQNRPM